MSERDDDRYDDYGLGDAGFGDDGYGGEDGAASEDDGERILPTPFDPAARAGVDDLYRALLARSGEAKPERRLDATRRAVELLGDPQRTYPVIHLTGTNGKTSTSRMTESILRAHGLRTGLFTSPHLVRFTERIVIDGLPIGDAQLLANWRDIEPVIDMVDAELAKDGRAALTYFEALTVLAYASFAEAPVDVAVIEVGMGGEWDSTNVADGEVAVFTPISLDHQRYLGDTLADIARTKSGIIKPAARVVMARQPEEAAAEIARAVELAEGVLRAEGVDYAVEESLLAVGGQSVTIRGTAGTYANVFLPLFGAHQAQNAAAAVVAVEQFLGGGAQRLDPDILAEGLGTATSPGRLQVIGHGPTVLIDAAHNPGGAEVLAAGLTEFFDFDEFAIVLGIVSDKDVEGILAHLGDVADRFHISQSHSDRSIEHGELADRVRDAVPGAFVQEADTLAEAIEEARAWAAEEPKRAVVITGSIILIGEAIVIAEEEGWRV